MFTAFERPAAARVTISFARPLRSLVMALTGLITARLVPRLSSFPTAMKIETHSALPLWCATAWLAGVATGHAAELHANTAAAFDRYVHLTETRLNEETRGIMPFLWIDSLTAAQRHDADARLRRGEVIVRRMETRDAGRVLDIPGGMCHHWIGTVFLPSVSLDRTAALMQAYDDYPEIYRPVVRRSEILSRDGDRVTVSLQFLMKKVVTVVLNTEYQVRYVHVSSTRMQVRSATTRIAEVRHPDTLDEQEMAIGHDSGFLWRFNNYCALEERREGTYVQCETVSLSRNIPTGLDWLIGPFVTSIPRESLAFTLQAMHRALTTGRQAEAVLNHIDPDPNAALVVDGSMTYDASATPTATVTNSIATAWW
jgi:hypothetical protein